MTWEPPVTYTVIADGKTMPHITPYGLKEWIKWGQETGTEIKIKGAKNG